MVSSRVAFWKEQQKLTMEFVTYLSTNTAFLVSIPLLAEAGNPAGVQHRPVWEEPDSVKQTLLRVIVVRLNYKMNFKNFNVKSLKYFRTDSLCQIKPSNFTGVDPAIPHFCRMGNVRGNVDPALQNITVLNVLIVPLNKMNNNTGGDLSSSLMCVT